MGNGPAAWGRPSKGSRPPSAGSAACADDRASWSPCSRCRIRVRTSVPIAGLSSAATQPSKPRLSLRVAWSGTSERITPRSNSVATVVSETRLRVADESGSSPTAPVAASVCEVRRISDVSTLTLSSRVATRAGSIGGAAAPPLILPLTAMIDRTTTMASLRAASARVKLAGAAAQRDTKASSSTRSIAACSLIAGAVVARTAVAPEPVDHAAHRAARSSPSFWKATSARSASGPVPRRRESADATNAKSRDQMCGAKSTTTGPGPAETTVVGPPAGVRCRRSAKRSRASQASAGGLGWSGVLTGSGSGSLCVGASAGAAVPSVACGAAASAAGGVDAAAFAPGSAAPCAPGGAGACC